MATNIAQFAKKTLENYVPEVDKYLASYWQKELNRNFGFNPRQKTMVKELLLHSKEHNLRPSKRIRASFVSFGYKLSGQEVTSDVWKAACAIELVHTGILMHDDFMDRDDTRRAGPTTHKFFEGKLKSAHLGEAMAVTVGDAIFWYGFELLNECANSEVMSQMIRSCINTAYGQAYDVSLESFVDWTEDDVITLHKAKTAIYTYQNPLFVGALLGGIKDKKVYEILEAYSMDGGVAFQLQDDILGIFGTPEKTGKSADSDLLQGKCTLMVLNVLEHGTEPQKQALKKVWGQMTAKRADLDAAKQAILESGSYDYNKRMAQEYARKAASEAAKLRLLSNLNEEAIDYIQGIAEYMVIRDV